MSKLEKFYATAQSYLEQNQPDRPVLFLSPQDLEVRHRLFQKYFPGQVTFAVKAHPSAAIISALSAQGMRAFDVASPVEIAQIRALAPQAALHYNNPVRSKKEIKAAIDAGVTSYAVDRMGELEKLLLELSQPTEISVRIALRTQGGTIDFGSKFGATRAGAIDLLHKIQDRGHRPAMCFHPGTQCLNADAWNIYMAECAKISKAAGVKLQRLNVGGGFPAQRKEDPIDLPHFFETIKTAWRTYFPQDPPKLLCEPGRALVADAFKLATHVKAVEGTHVFLNDGIYGCLSEMRDIGISTRFQVIRDGKSIRNQKTRNFTVFGPTCDSLDVLPAPLALPRDIKEGDYILFDGTGAYSSAIATRFNGYGDFENVFLTR